MDYRQSDSSLFQYRFFKLWQVIGLLMILAVTWLSLTPKPPNINLPFEFGDKILHFLAYFTLMFWHGQLYRTTTARLGWIAGFVIMGIAIEVLQGMGVARLFEWADAVANTLGAVAAYLLLKTKMETLLLRVESRVLRR